MIVKLLTEHHLEFLRLRGCRGSPDTTHVKIPHCWKSHVGSNMDVITDPDEVTWKISVKFCALMLRRPHMK